MKTTLASKARKRVAAVLLGTVIAGGAVFAAAPASAAGGSCLQILTTGIPASTIEATCKGTVKISWWCVTAPLITNTGTYTFPSTSWGLKKFTGCNFGAVGNVSWKSA